MTFDPVADPVFRCWHTQADPSADCHKLKVNVRELDTAILSIIRKQAEVVLNSDNLDNLRQRNDAENKASDCDKLIAELNEKRQALYERFITRELERPEYLKLKDECSAEIDRLSKQAASAKAEAKARTVDPSVLELVKRTADETIPYKELINALIDKIYVYPNKNIEIVWKIADFTKQN